MESSPTEEIEKILSRVQIFVAVSNLSAWLPPSALVAEENKELVGNEGGKVEEDEVRLIDEAVMGEGSGGKRFRGLVERYVSVSLLVGDILSSFRFHFFHGSLTFMIFSILSVSCSCKMLLPEQIIAVNIRFLD